MNSKINEELNEIKQAILKLTERLGELDESMRQAPVPSAPLAPIQNTALAPPISEAQDVGAATQQPDSMFSPEFLSNVAAGAQSSRASSSSSSSSSSLTSSSSSTSTSQSMGSFLGAVGVVCFVLAATFLVRLAIDAGWLTPIRQMGLSFALGAGLLGGALLMRKYDSEYAGYLGGAAIIALYIASLASHLYFNIASSLVAIGLASGVALLSIWLFRFFRSDFFLVTAAVGSYLSPLLLGRMGSVEFVSVYFLIWSATFAYISVALESRMLPQISAYLAFGLYAFFHVEQVRHGSAAWAATVQFFQFVIFLAGVVRHTIITKKPLSSSEAFSYFPLLIFFYGTEYYFLNQIVPGFAPWISLGFAGLLLLGYEWARHKLKQAESLASLQVVRGFAAVAIFHSGYLILLPDIGRAWLLPAVLIYLSFVPTRNSKSFEFKGNYIYLLMIGIAVLEYGRLVLNLFVGGQTHLVVAGIVNTVALTYGYLSLRKRNIFTEENSHPYLGFVHLLGVLSLYRISDAWGSLAVSAVWGFYAVGVLLFAFSRKDSVLGKSSLLVLLLASGKAFLYDVSSANDLVRILCLLLTGAVLYVSGYILRKLQQFE